MKPSRAILLLDVLLAMALLGLMAAMLVSFQRRAVDQVLEAQRREAIAAELEALLVKWNLERRSVTLPDDGFFRDGIHWRRDVESVRAAAEVPATHVSVVVWQDEPHGGTLELCRVDWLVPSARTARENR